MFPEKLKKGDKVRVIAPSQSMAIISEESKDIAVKRFKELGLELSFGKHIEEMDEFVSTSIASRIEDLHDAYRDPEIKAIFTVIGGFNSNQLLQYIDWDLIKDNPKIFCGFSDITVLNNAIYAKTGLVTYSGTHYSTFGQKLHFDYTLDYVKKCLFEDKPFKILPSSAWTDDRWWEDQQDRKPITNSGWLKINEGESEGTILGANLCTFNLLQGTEYFPNLENSILFLEDDEMSGEFTPVIFDRDLQSIIHQPGFSEVKGILIGRFQKISQMTDEKLIKIIKTKKELNNIPVIANVDFGHTSPMITYPIGGVGRIFSSGKELGIEVLEH
ncbi:MAG: S66 peptidase family protein [Patescibacteria group bacterium]|nr:S66 peptidase family protein [Patescibacteria group bacterium]